MQIFRSIDELGCVPGPVFLSIGVFDGVHVGHQAVIRRALDDAAEAGGSAVVVTFDPHPVRVLRPESAPRLLTSTRHQKVLLRRLGVRYLLIVPFDKTFAATPPETFVRQLHAAASGLREICVGHAWSFGKGRAGNLELLRELGDRLGFDEVGIPAVEVEGQIVSSTLTRAAVEAGELEKAARFLGRPFSLLGTVTEGRKLGRDLGFPTANLRAHNEQFPPNGVYAVRALLPGEREARPGVLNIGTRPTVHGDAVDRVPELHLFGYEGDLYGIDVEVFFQSFIRPERRFPDVEALKAQIAEDVAEARRRL